MILWKVEVVDTPHVASVVVEAETNTAAIKLALEYWGTQTTLRYGREMPLLYTDMSLTVRTMPISRTDTIIKARPTEGLWQKEE